MTKCVLYLKPSSVLPDNLEVGWRYLYDGCEVLDIKWGLCRLDKADALIEEVKAERGAGVEVADERQVHGQEAAK